MERHAITFGDLVGLHRLDHVEIADGAEGAVGRRLELVTDAGRFTFPVSRWADAMLAIDSHGFWEPDVTVEAGIGLVVMCRVVPNPESMARRLYFVDETTSLVVLEFGYLDRRYDDPNLRTWRAGVFRWEHGTGWESPYLDVPDDIDGEPIRKKWSYTPKRVPGSPPKGRY